MNEGSASRITDRLSLPAGRPPGLPLPEFIRRVHQAADDINALGTSTELPAPVRAAIERYVAELDQIDLNAIEPFEFELLIIFAKLHSVLPDHPGRPMPIYYGVRGILEKVVNLKHASTPVSHALVAHALDQLTRLRVARLAHIAQFDEQIRNAFEDLERLQREDTLGDAEGLRLGAGLVVFTKAVAALDQYDAFEITHRAHELELRFEPIAEAIRQAAASRRDSLGQVRRARIHALLSELLTSPTLIHLPNLGERVKPLIDLVAHNVG